MAAGQQLASVRSAAENALLVTAVADNAVWIGGTDAASEGAWVWSPSNTSVSYTNWKVGEPNDVAGGEHCLHFKGDGRWNDERCSKGFRYVCMSLPPPPPPPLPSPPPPSPPPRASSRYRGRQATINKTATGDEQRTNQSKTSKNKTKKERRQTSDESK